MKLGQDTLQMIAKQGVVRAPTLVPKVSGIAHFGVGNFHRAHEALYTQLACEESGEQEWGILGVGLLPFDKKMNHILTKQNFLYTLVEKGTQSKPTYRIINAIHEHVYGGDGNWKEVVHKVSDEQVKIITFTITEGGYNINKNTNLFDWSNPCIVQEVENWKDNPTTVFGYLANILSRRMNTHGKGLTLLSCDNIQHNGKVLQTSLGEFLSKAAPEVLDWTKKTCTFPNSMVDRITPQTSPAQIQQLMETVQIEDEWPVFCEDFRQWVVEDRFVGSRPKWEKVGVQFVQDVSPYEKMKLRILNASHQALCYLGYLEGYKFVDQAASDKLINQFVLKYLREEVVATLDAVPGIDLQAYQKEVLNRFANPNIKDTISRICEYTSDRIPLFNVPAMIEMFKQTKPIPLSAMVVASWIAYASCKDEKGQPINIVDLRKEEIMKVVDQIQQDGGTERFMKIEGLFGVLAAHDQFNQDVRKFYHSLRTKGVHGSLQLLL